MASIRKHSGRNSYQIRFYIDRARREWYVPISEPTPKATRSAENLARQIGRYLDDLSHSKSTGERPKAESKAWIATLDAANRNKLVALGLAEPLSNKLATDAGKFLGPFVDAYLESRTDAKATTITNYKQTRRLLVEHFGERKALAAITTADCEKWRRWLLGDKKLAQPTVSKHIKRAKTMLSEAVADRLLDTSPMANVKAGTDRGAAKHHIDADSAQRILDKCPDAEWRCVFALARWGGMRRDCEIQQLRWSDIDWAESRITINSGKTGLRQCPLFPELQRVLANAAEIVPHRAEFGEFVIGRLSEHTNLGRGLATIVERAGVEQWPKLFNALRATRRTELQKQHPSHVVDSWLGHSSQTACDYYLQVTEEDWQTATQICTHFCTHQEGENTSPTQSITSIQTQQKTPENIAYDASWGVLDTDESDPYGVRTHVAAVKGRCPRPLDEGAVT